MTGRLPFEPNRVKSTTVRKDDEPWTVSILADRIDSALKQGIPKKIKVQGEVSGFRDRTHWYFDLKDENAVVHITMFASAARRARIKPENGHAIVVTGRVEYYAQGGRTSLIASSIAPVGLGDLEQRFRELCEQLRSLGWFAQERKRPLPAFPRRIAVITSRSGAALQDVIDTARRRMPSVELVLVDARVQGAQAAGEVAHAIEALGRHHEQLGLDAILITRGGGSMEDLWAFNEKIVAQAIYNCPIPVVAAIGHETDTTVAELVADLRCATPTQAAMKMIPDRAALLAQVDSLDRRLKSDLRYRLKATRQTIQSLLRRPSLASSAHLIDRQRDRLDHHQQQLRGSIRRLLDQQRTRLEHAQLTLQSVSPEALHQQRRHRLDEMDRSLRGAIVRRLSRAKDKAIELDRHLQAVSPLAILDRGYSITTDESGRAIRDANEVESGQIIHSRLARGLLHSRVEKTEADPENSPSAKTPPRQVPPPVPDSDSDSGNQDDPQMDLFGSSR